MNLTSRILVAGVELDANKRIIPALTRIYGIGKTRSAKICHEINIAHKRAKELTPEELLQLRKIVGQYLVEEDLKKEVHDSVSDLIDMRSRRGMRMKLGLPVRGQRTSSNAKTAKRHKR